MTTPRRATGDSYEDRALAFLRAQGMRLVERNFNTRYGELDLVMESGEMLVFIEVRYRQHGGYGGAVASVTASKQRKLVRAASLYLQANPQRAQQPCRFDVLAFGDADGEPEWIPNAFEAY